MDECDGFQELFIADSLVIVSVHSSDDGVQQDVVDTFAIRLDEVSQLVSVQSVSWRVSVDVVVDG